VQQQARTQVEAFAVPRTSVWDRTLGRWAGRQGQGLYLDGGFGVGKTHLLAAAWQAAPWPVERKAYLSFQELVYLVGLLGSKGAKDAFAGKRLLCIDEFELDDPGNTLIVSKFLRQAMTQGTDVMTTSNTPPASQGQGRFAADDFRREIQGIAERFTVVALDGADYRAPADRRDVNDAATYQSDLETAPAGSVVADSGELTAFLRLLHPVRYGEFLKTTPALFLEQLPSLPEQNDALRFVHFVDKAYDLGIGLRVGGSRTLDDVFNDTYMNGAYAKKHRRCLSRLSEMLREPLPTGR
jgi:cell division protein ZapE